MGNRLEGTATFDYEGQTYRLTLNNRVLMDAERVLGYSSLDAAEEARQALAVGRNPMLRTVVAIFYGALHQNHPAVTEDEAIDMFMADDPAPQTAFKEILLGVEPPKPVGNGRKKAAAKK
ncbi:hypothetical protein CMI47_05540 [Candidatus Pacearchaeota archaeon]|jgi:hypothetical protein|nr:hypothetical protein [Candidatus Pacearchaeota archaeon]|tara:strand:- start:73 stop:432 length:360 start_codon:yes stop_codon:yes gene_type:complete